MNEAFCSTFGRFREEIIGKTLVEDVPPNEQDHFLAIDRQVLANGKENSCEETLTVKGSKTSTILTKKTRYVAENGDEYLVGVIHDITERRKHETALRKSEKRYKELFENAPFPYQSLDKVLSTTRSKDAEKMAEECDGQINLLITDVVMPEMNGRELSEQLQRLYPQLKILFMSGYTANVIAHRGVLDEGINFISKPFSPKEIAFKIREVLD